MNILGLSLSKIRSNPANALVSITLFAIGTGIISLLINGEKRLQRQFEQNLAGIDLVVGAKGSPLQLILSSVFHLDTPTGNISLAEAGQISRNPMVEKTIPLAMGDNHHGFRIIGTNREYPALYNGDLKEGNWFEKPYEAVIGAEAASRTRLRTGDHFTGRHGFSHQGHSHDDDIYTVTGILQKTGTVIDGLILTTLETYWMIHSGHLPVSDSGHSHLQDHAHDGECCPHHKEDPDHPATADCEPIPPSQPNSQSSYRQSGCSGDWTSGHHADNGEEETAWEDLVRKLDAREELSSEEMALYRSRSDMMTERHQEAGDQITALLVFYSTPRAAVQLPRLINDNTSLQAASPALETHRLFTLAGTAITFLKWLAWIIIAISGLNIFIHLTHTLHQNLHEVALIRTLGASRLQVMLLLVLQGLWPALAGGVTGTIAGKILVAWLPGLAHLPGGEMYNVNPDDLLLLGYAAVAGVVSALLPAIKAYRTDVHHILTRK